MPQCSTCGSVVPSDSTICPGCGMELSAAVSGSPAEPASPSANQPTSSTTPEAMPSPPAPAASGGSGKQARLTLRRGGAPTSEVFNFGGEVVVGRFDAESGPVDVDLGLLPEASYLSRHHAKIWCDPAGQWLIRDLGSQNGTFVKAVGTEKFQPASGDQPLGDGDEVAFGNARFEFRTS